MKKRQVKKTVRTRLSSSEAKSLGLEPKENDKGRNTSRYNLTLEQAEQIKGEAKVSNRSNTSDNQYSQNAEKFVLTAWNSVTGQMMNIDSYCEHYSLPREDVRSYKLVSHTGTPYYNIVFKETIDVEVEKFDFEAIINKYIEDVKPVKTSKANTKFAKDFDTLTYTDVHVGMDTNSDKNAMYAVEWNRASILASANEMVSETLAEQESDTLIVDELGDFLDGYNAQTTRGGHALPQNMTNEEAFDCALEFKMLVLDGLINNYNEIKFHNICNDNHAGSFGYFVNSAFKQIAERKYGNKVEVVNMRQFMNHYYIQGTCYILTHGKDDKSLKFGFKPFLDSKGIEKIDQYCKQNDIYKNSTNVVFKKGDSHQMLLDLCTSDDFYYFNYPALSPSSQWVQTNFKKGRRGFVNESSVDGKITVKPFLK